MREMTPHGCDRRDRVLFLDVGVKRVVHAGNVRMPDRVEMRRQVGHRGEKIAFEPIDRFDGDGDSARARDLAGRLVKVDAASTLLLGRRRAGEMAERRVERPADDFRAHRRDAFDDPFDVLQGGRALFPRLANRVHVDARE